MRQSSRIESLSYGLIYALGSGVAAFLSLSQGTPLERLALHVACSWGYVIYYVLHMR
ncbi:MAG TPA: hypothetical protein VLH09_05770 [Bryobacteraceae bacterium]|nr:hypothetical protein [Bryobacteraceae bacterium]